VTIERAPGNWTSPSPNSTAIVVKFSTQGRGRGSAKTRRSRRLRRSLPDVHCPPLGGALPCCGYGIG
jgi:hypothetical protein